MMGNLDSIDFRLIDVSAELHYLEEHLATIEAEISKLASSEKAAFEARSQMHTAGGEGFDWDAEHQVLCHRLEFLLPRFFRNPFLVALYATLESSTTEIANKIQSQLGQQISMGDLKGNFLERAKKYYKHILQFELYSNQSDWHRIQMLSELRHAIAHVNGRLEILQKSSRDKICGWEREGLGLEIILGYVIVEQRFVDETFSAVQSFLSDLLDRYKRWDNERGGRGGQSS